MTDIKPPHLKLVHSNDKPAQSSNPEWQKMPPELQAIIRQKEAEMQRRNLTPLDDFAGLNPLQMHELLKQPINNPLSPIVLLPVTETMFSASPIAQALAMALQYFSGEKGAKLTPQGRWPRKLILEMFPLFEHLGEFRLFKPRLEEDLRPAEVLHLLLTKDGMVRKLKGNELLTKKGRELHDKGKDEQLDWLQFHMTETFNWAYLDGYNETPLLQRHWPFMIWLLLNYGKEDRPVRFYAEGFTRAWPMMLEAGPLHHWETPESHVLHVMRLRMMERWLVWLGWATTRYEGQRFDGEMFVQATPAFFARWEIRS